MGTRRAAWGEAKAWLRQAAATDSTECLNWPFSANGQTPRPTVGHGSHGTRPASHAVLELAGTPVPSDRQVNHTCDNSFCCNPKHLYVGTQKQNTDDAISRGRRNALSPEVVSKIVALGGTHGATEISRTLGVSRDAVRYYLGKKA